jgi:hypothetical protein
MTEEMHIAALRINLLTQAKLDLADKLRSVGYLKTSDGKLHPYYDQLEKAFTDAIVADAKFLSSQSELPTESTQRAEQ